MSSKKKTILTTVLLIMALVQGPVIYYFGDGFIKLLFAVTYMLLGLILTIILLVNVIKSKVPNTTYQIIGLSIAFLAGIGTTVRPSVMEYIDYRLRFAERSRIVEQIKRGSLKPGEANMNGVNIRDSAQGTVSVEFYIDRGFIDHYSAFLYTDDQTEIRALDKAIIKDHIFKKLDENWYRVGY
jgi:hypothetical protein